MSAYVPKHAAYFLGALFVSLLLLLLGAWLVLGLWYPKPFWAVTGVFALGGYAVVLHLGITALLMLPWRSRLKAGSLVASDVTGILWVLVTATLFSLSVFAGARPVALVYVVDQVSLVRASEIRVTEFALPGLAVRRLRWSGPLPLFSARPSSDMERFEAVQLAMKGFDLAQRPSRWMAWSPEDTGLADGSVLVLDGVKGEWGLAFDADAGAYVPRQVRRFVAP